MKDVKQLVWYEMDDNSVFQIYYIYSFIRDRWERGEARLQCTNCDV